MASVTITLAPLTSTSGGTTTTTLTNFEDAYALTVSTPTTLTSTGVSVQVELTSTGTNFQTLQSGGVDVQMIAARATVFCPTPFKQLRLVCTAAEGAARSFAVAKTVLT